MRGVDRLLFYLRSPWSMGVVFLLFLIGLFPEVARSLETVIGKWGYILLVSFLSSYLATAFIRPIAFHLKILDHPDPRKIHAKPIPLLGGLAFALAILFTLVWNYELSFGMRRIFLAAFILLLVGTVDDIVGLSARFRLVVQVAASLFVIYFTDTRFTFLPDTLWGDVGEWVLTVFWIVGIINAFNFFDGMDGLAASLAGLSALTFFWISLRLNNPALAFISLSLLGAMLGFLVFNFNPAVIFMGDGGSTFLGFLLAVFAVYGVWSTSHAIVSFSVPILILSPIIFDMIYTTIARFYRGDVSTIREWLEYTGKDHLHHRLADLGFSPRYVVAFILLIQSITCIAAILMKTVTIRGMVLLVLQSILVYLVVVILMLLSQRHISWRTEIEEKIERLRVLSRTRKQLKEKTLAEGLSDELDAVAKELIRDIERGI